MGAALHWKWFVKEGSRDDQRTQTAESDDDDDDYDFPRFDVSQ